MTNTAQAGVTPDNFDGLAATFGAESAQILRGFQARGAASAPRLRKKVAEIKADPAHPDRRALWSYEMQLRGAEQSQAVERLWLLPTARAPRRMPRPRSSRARTRSSARSSARSGDSGSDEPLGDLAGPCCCERCGTELLCPARLCGLCEEETGLPHEIRACEVCGRDISGRRAGAETCGPAHKKQLQRRRHAAAERGEEPHRTLVPPLDLAIADDALAGVDPAIIWCVYTNGTNSPRHLIEKRPWRGARGAITSALVAA